MSDSPFQGASQRSEVAHGSVDALVRGVLSEAGTAWAERSMDLQVAHVARLHAAVAGTERNAGQRAVAALIREGVDPEAIADHYVPAVARLLGQEWCEDLTGFAQVTIGVSRLQAMLRDLGPEWRADAAVDADAPAILVVVPVDVQHSLGGVLLAGQLRRKGFSVRLMLGAGPDDMTLRLRQAQFDAVMISAARGDHLEPLRRLIDALRTAIAPGVSITLGGTVIEEGGDVCARVGADHATSDIETALRLCRLGSTYHSARRNARRA